MNDGAFKKLGIISEGQWEHIIEESIQMNRKFMREYLDEKMMEEMMKVGEDKHD